ncbi:MAG TPA: ABC transporter substrate-binding protein [Verrucomicrobiae bacterium]|nr:ABC transporter substrate-binding protein [Verrucomicrobiae bacterium]
MIAISPIKMTVLRRLVRGRLDVVALSLGVVISLPAAEPSGETNDLPHRGGTMRIWSASDWRSLDPAVAFDAASLLLIKLLFRGLLDYDPQGNLVPDQAQEWSVSPDGKTFTFQLRPGMRFSHGREVEAEDYVFSLERVLNPKTGSPGQTYYLGILGAKEFAEGRAVRVAGLRAVNPRTLVIELAQPEFAFRYGLTLCFASVLPRELVARYGPDFQYHLAGSGPYRVAEWQRSVRWRLERNPFYGRADGWADAFDVMIGGEPMLAAMMIERGEIDLAIVSMVEAAIFSRDLRRRPFLHRVNMAATQYFFMNTELKPFDDKRVRQAISHAIDRGRLLKLDAGLGTPAYGIVPPMMPWSNPGLPRYDYDPAKARALLRQAGYQDGFGTEIWFIQSRVVDAKAAQSIQQDLREVGVQAELRPVSLTAFEVKARSRRQVPCGIWGWVQDYPDPSTFLDVLFRGDRITDTDCNNLAFYRNGAVDGLLAKATRSNQAEERRLLYREVERLIMEDAPWVPLCHEQLAVLCHPRVRGDMWHPVWLWRYENAWLQNQ